MKKILLIVPCFNEEKRLEFSKFQSGISNLKTMGFELSLLFANDGSSDGTLAMLQKYADNSNIFIYHSQANLGKANVIQAAYSSRATELNFDQYHWIGYWDADLATPVEEIPKMIGYAKFYQERIDSIWGSRISRLGSDIKRQTHRHYLGRIFVTLVSNVLNVKAYDSQCGAKLFSPETAKIAFEEPFLSKWIFDVEILLRLKNKTMVEFPLMAWKDVPGSKVKVFKEAFRTLRDLAKIKKYYSKKLPLVST